MEIHTLHPDQLARFIDRIRKFDVDKYESYLHSLFFNALSELGEFVPCEGAMILLDDPAHKHSGNQEGELIFVSAFGPKAQTILGKRIPATSGLIGETYVLGKSAVRKTEKKEKIVIDKINFPHPVNTLIAVPLKIETSVVGVLLIYNKKEPIGFTIRDLKLAEIFGGYISTSLQNAIDARKSQELSKRDDLTGLFNDRHFHRQLELEIRLADEKQTSLCLAFMDLDNFKSINDQYGHLVGSQTLKEIGLVIKEVISDKRATLARYGGDEYVMVLPGFTLEQAMEAADQIRKNIVSKLFMIDQGEQDGSFVNFKGVISCSVGIASLQDHVRIQGHLRERKNLFIRLADQAMYAAKEAGKNRVSIAKT